VGRPSQVEEKRKELLPTIARAFADLGYRRVTTAELAERCRVNENALYRLWRDKKAMFIAALDYVFERATGAWRDVLAKAGRGTPAERLLAYEARHIGEFGHMRIIFAGLSEADDPEIRQALVAMYCKYHAFVLEQVAAHHGTDGRKGSPDHSLTAWAFVALGTMCTIAVELELLPERTRQRLLTDVGLKLLDGGGAP
jgi:AcrR family transcriptional regulator